MQREEYTVGSWCRRWFQDNCCKWNPRTEGGYRNLIEHHITPGIGEVGLSLLDEQAVTDFYENLYSKELNNRSVWCVHLLLRRCMDEAARDCLISHNPVRYCTVPEHEERHPVRLRLIDVQGYLKNDVSLESFAAGFKLASGIAKELEADGLYSF